MSIAPAEFYQRCGNVPQNVARFTCSGWALTLTLKPDVFILKNRPQKHLLDIRRYLRRNHAKNSRRGILVLHDDDFTRTLASVIDNADLVVEIQLLACNQLSNATMARAINSCRL